MDSSIPSVLDPRTRAFRFLDLPPELRQHILELVLIVGRTVDLDPRNSRRIAPRLQLFLSCRKIHDEAYGIFYGNHTFRLFPTHGRFFGDRIQPLITRLSPLYRAAITSLELRLGPGWSNPPMSWVVDKRLGLTDAISVRVLKVFVECDPSHDCFRGFRMDEPSFTDFAKSLLIQIISSIPSLEVIQFDGYPSVSKFDPLMSELLHVTKANEKRIAWGSERAWGSAGLSA